MKQGTQSRCTGTTQKDGVRREVGEGFGTGGHMYMEFRKMVPMIIPEWQQRRQDVKNRLLDSSGRRQGWDDLREYH